MIITFNSKKVAKAAANIAGISANTIKVEVMAHKKNQSGDCYAFLVASDGVATSSVRLTVRADGTEEAKYFFGKEFCDFVIKASQFGDEIKLNTKEKNAQIVAGSCKTDISYKAESEIQAFVDIDPKDMIGMLAISSAELKKAMNQGSYCAATGNQGGSFLEEVHFVPLISESSNKLLIESLGTAMGTAAAGELLGSKKSENAKTIPAFKVNVKRLGALSHLEGEKVAITVTKGHVVFATATDQVILPLLAEVNGDDEKVAVPTVHGLIFVKESRILAKLRINKNDFLSAVSMAQMVSDADADEATNGKIVMHCDAKGIMIESKNGNSKIKVACESDSEEFEFPPMILNPVFVGKACSVSEDTFELSVCSRLVKGAERSIVKVRYDLEDIGGCFIAPIIK